MDIEKGNRLIAEFDGWESDKYPNLPNRLHKIDTGEEVGKGIENFEYHSSWDALMPVVEKISKIKTDWSDAEIHDTYYPRTFGMLSPNGNPMVRINAHQVFEAETLIEATWLAVVDFLEGEINQGTNFETCDASNAQSGN